MSGKVISPKTRQNGAVLCFYQRVLAFISGFLCVGMGASIAVEREYTAENEAIQQSTAQVAQSVVQISTVGGFERIGEVQTSQGPTTGLIVSSDGYIVSSAFNFAQRPSSILVQLPDGKRVAAELVARDLSRMLALLKVDADDELAVPTFVPESEIAVGQWAIALGRTFQQDSVDTSLGIISAVKRMQGRVIQTDCNVSTANYGGPLIDIRGRVYGVLVPMSPQPGGEGIEAEVAGAEFYDSGIGFAVPLEHVFSVLDKWKQGDDLLPGKLGVAMKPGNAYVEPPTIATIWPGSPAAKALWKVDDTIIAINGTPIQTQVQSQLQLRPRYAGDTLTVSLRRGNGDNAEEFDTEITLAGELEPYQAAFLGILPKHREDEVIVQAVWPESGAARAGLREGDSLKKLGEVEITDLAAARKAMKTFQPSEEIEITLVRDEKEVKLRTTLSSLPEDILPELDGFKPQAMGEPRELEVLKLPQFPQEAKFLTPPNVKSPGLVLWLAENKKTDEAALVRRWQPICDGLGLVLLVGQPSEESGWQFDDLEYLDALASMSRTRFGPDPARTIVMGSGKAGQLAYTLGLRRRGAFAGIVVDNAPLPRTLKVPENTPGGQLALLTLLPKNSNFAPLVKHDVAALRAAGYPVSVLERNAVGEKESADFDPSTFGTVVRWITGLGRL